MTDLVQLSLDDLTPARTARDEGLARVEAASSEWEKAVIDQAIVAMAETGKPFSANDFRDLLPEIRTRKLIGQRCRDLAQKKDAPIIAVGEVTSTDKGTHAKPIKVYIGARFHADRLAS